MKTKILIATAVSALALNGFAQTEQAVNNDPVAKPEAVNTTDVATTEKYTPYNGMIDLQSIDSDVYNHANESIGNIDRYVANSANGKVEYAVISVGGFLGIGDKLVAVPWEDLQFKQAIKPAATEEADTDAETANEVDAKEADPVAGNNTTDEANTETDEASKADDETTVENEGYAEKEKHSDVEIRIFLDRTKEQLEKAPEFDPENLDSFQSKKTEVTKA